MGLYDTDGAHEVLVADIRRFVDFCNSDLARYQLLFQRTVRGFEPSAGSYARAVRAMAHLRTLLGSNGITDPSHVDMWTALTIGLVDQQISNDPGGDRWVRLIDDFVSMFLAHCQPPKRAQRRKKKEPTWPPSPAPARTTSR